MMQTTYSFSGKIPLAFVVGGVIAAILVVIVLIAILNWPKKGNGDDSHKNHGIKTKMSGEQTSGQAD
jgi:hypothetical protein